MVHAIDHRAYTDPPPLCHILRRYRVPIVSVTLDSGRGKRRLLRQWLTRGSSKGVFEEQGDEGVFEGLL